MVSFISAAEWKKRDRGCVAERDDMMRIKTFTECKYLAYQKPWGPIPYCPVRGQGGTMWGWGSTNCKALLRAPQSLHGSGTLQRHRQHQSVHGTQLSVHITLQKKKKCTQGFCEIFNKQRTIKRKTEVTTRSHKPVGGVPVWGAIVQFPDWGLNSSRWWLKPFSGE